MTIKYLANRVQGTRAERFPSLKSTGISLTGCKAYYPFNEGAVNYAITTNGFPDGLGSVINGTYSVNDPNGSITPTEGISGNGGLALGGVAAGDGQNIICGTNTTISGTGDFTYSIWCKPFKQAANGNRMLLGNYGSLNSGGVNCTQGNTEGNELYLAEGDSNKVKYYHPSGGAASTAGIPYNAWVHIAVTRASGALKIYINGAVDGTSTDSGSVDGCHMRIGGLAKTSESFAGSLAEASIWSRALTAAEILSLSSLGSATVFDETDTHRSYVKTSATEWTEVT